MKALMKDSLMEIKNTLKRFLSILLIVLLGVGFFAGIKATSPDMKDTLDHYFDQQNVMDIEVISTMGLTESDIAEIAGLEGVETVVGSYSKDAMITVDKEDMVVKLNSLPKENGMNGLEIIQGRLPETEGECVVEDGFLKGTEIQIGDTIEIQPEKGEEEEEFLKTKTMKIVGSVKSPLYISRERGSSKLRFRKN